MRVGVWSSVGREWSESKFIFPVLFRSGVEVGGGKGRGRGG